MKAEFNRMVIMSLGTIVWSSLGFGSAGELFAQSQLSQDSHIPHLSLIFIMPETEPFAQFLCQLWSTHQL